MTKKPQKNKTKDSNIYQTIPGGLPLKLIWSRPKIPTQQQLHYETLCKHCRPIYLELLPCHCFIQTGCLPFCWTDCIKKRGGGAWIKSAPTSPGTDYNVEPRCCVLMPDSQTALLWSTHNHLSDLQQTHPHIPPSKKKKKSCKQSQQTLTAGANMNKCSSTETLRFLVYSTATCCAQPWWHHISINIDSR